MREKRQTFNRGRDLTLSKLSKNHRKSYVSLKTHKFVSCNSLSAKLTVFEITDLRIPDIVEI